MAQCRRILRRDLRLLGYFILCLMVRPLGLATLGRTRKPLSMKGSVPTSGVRGSPWWPGGKLSAWWPARCLPDAELVQVRVEVPQEQPRCVGRSPSVPYHRI